MDLRFDRFQFERRARAVSAKTCIAFSDYERMGKTGIEGRFRPNIPPWALDDKKIATVVKVICWKYLHGGGRNRTLAVPDISIEELGRRIAEKQKRDSKRLECVRLSDAQKLLIRNHVRDTNRPGGYPGLYTRIIWLAYRQGFDSVSIAKEVVIRPEAVRIHLCKANRYARRLWPELALPKDEKRAANGRVSARPNRPEDGMRRSEMKKATIQKHITRLEKLASRNRGVLPSYTWLNANGFFGSYDIVRAAGKLGQFRRASRN